MYEFQWTFYDEGYRWVDYEPILLHEGTLKGPFLSTGYPIYDRRSLKAYLPLRKPGMFQDFAHTALTQDAIGAFADRYGLLYRELIFYPPMGLPKSRWDGEHMLLSPQNNKSKHQDLVYGESIEDWQREILAMRQVVGLWDLAKAGSINTLAQHIKWYDEKHVAYESHPELKECCQIDIFRGNIKSYVTDSTIVVFSHCERIGGELLMHTWKWIATPEVHPEFLGHLKEGDIRQAALCYVQSVISGYIKKDTSPTLLWNPERNQRDIYLRPRTLRAALWLQFAHAVTGNKHYQECPECGKWFEVAESRTNRRYCDELACRNKAYRRRKARAQEIYENLTAAGIDRDQSVQRISEELGNDVDKVRVWTENL